MNDFDRAPRPSDAEIDARVKELSDADLLVEIADHLGTPPRDPHLRLSWWRPRAMMLRMGQEVLRLRNCIRALGHDPATLTPEEVRALGKE